MQSWILLLINAQIITIILSAKPMAERYNDEYDEDMQNLERECLAEENIPDRFELANYSVTQHFLAQIEHSRAIPRNAKCFLRCWYKKLKIIKEQLVASIGPIPELSRPLRDCNKVATEWAQKQSGGDECEFAWSFYNCVREGMAKCLT
uniref:Uncharacterized protein n=1 Tax=Glossina austeni TaxID=7395 RepID=A0A1A9V858_GLOAU